MVLFMNNKQRKTYSDIFKEPVASDIEWGDIESLFLALGAEISEGSGSRVRVLLSGERAVFHRPHPERTTDKGVVRAVRRFLSNAGARL